MNSRFCTASAARKATGGSTTASSNVAAKNSSYLAATRLAEIVLGRGVQPARKGSERVSN
jgi:hypothetical protein